MLDVVLDFMLDRVHTVAHVSLHLAFGQLAVQKSASLLRRPRLRISEPKPY